MMPTSACNKFIADKTITKILACEQAYEGCCNHTPKAQRQENHSAQRDSVIHSGKLHDHKSNGHDQHTSETQPEPFAAEHPKKVRIQ